MGVGERGAILPAPRILRSVWLTPELPQMALLSGFASVSAPWHAFADSGTRRHPQVSAANIARKQAGLDATREMLTTKHHRLRLLQKKAEAATEASSSSGLVAKLVGSLPGLGTGDAAESKTLRREISGLQAVEASLLSSLSALQSRKAAAARAGTTVGRLLVVATYAFSCYCVYRILATSLTTMRRAFNPAASFSTSDPISRFLGLLAKHWDPKLDQVAWARQMSFLLSGVILAASANSVVQTFHIFAKYVTSPGETRTLGLPSTLPKTRAGCRTKSMTNQLLRHKVGAESALSGPGKPSSPHRADHSHIRNQRCALVEIKPA